MITNSPGEDTCGATFPAWLSGNHPNVADGTVKRKVCINKHGECSVSSNIDAKNCGSYYIYKFTKRINACDFRYCGTD